MEKFVTFFQPFKQYIVEAALVGISLIVVLVSVIIYVASVKAETKNQQSASYHQQTDNVPATKDEEMSSLIVVDITGAVLKPDSYELPTNARLKDVVSKAGGLSDMADKDFFYRNYNLARILSDQEKIYIPSVLEVSSGIFRENSRVIIAPSYPDMTLSNGDNLSEESSKIHINSASLEQLDSLPSIGTTTAQKIIDNRPYNTPDELISKKTVGNATFSKIKDLIDL